MITFQFVLFFIIAYLCLYALIDRICKCIEHCATSKAYGKYKENEDKKGVGNEAKNIVEKA